MKFSRSGAVVRQNQISGVSSNSLYCAFHLCESCVGALPIYNYFKCNEISKVEIGIEVNSTQPTFTMYSDNQFLSNPSKAHVKVGTNTTTLNYQSYYQYSYKVLPTTTTFSFESLLSGPLCTHSPDLDLQAPNNEPKTNLFAEINSVGEQGINQSLNIYPNPLSDKLFLKTNSTIESVKLFNALGVLVLEVTNFDILTGISVPAEISNGTYLVSVTTTNNTVHNQRVVLLR